MIRLFAGLGGDGAMRFIGEVERGAACGCRCPECGSPLVAKQGNEKEWHFAHEGGQERPECEAGATNMLRRLAVEYLRAQPVLEFPSYRERVQVRSLQRELTEVVAREVRIVGAVEWIERSPKASPVGLARIETGDELEIFVEIGDQQAHGHSPGTDANASIVFWSTLPAVSDLRERSYAEQHLRNHGQFIWRHLPDSLHIAEAARTHLLAQAAQDDEQVHRARQRQAADAGRKWAGIADRLQQRPLGEVHLSDNHEPEANVTAPKRPEAPPQSYDWAPDQKMGSSFVFYRLRDGSAWVVYTRQDASYAIAAWPRAEDGWDEALPPSVGTPDKTLGVYRASDLGSAMTFLAPRADIVRATSDPREFEATVR